MSTPSLHAGLAEGITDTVALSFALPPAPVQVTLYVVVAVGETETEPPVAPPLENPVSVQVVAFVELQVSVLLSPSLIVLGEAVRVAVGGGVVSPLCEDSKDTVAASMMNPPVFRCLKTRVLSPLRQ